MNEPPYVGGEPGAPVSKKRGLPGWLIALIAVVGTGLTLLVILLALGIHGYLRFIRASKTAEARFQVGKMAKLAATAFDDRNVICPSSSRPVPADVSAVRGKKYLAAPLEWEVDKATNAGFACLGFSVADPQYYQYDYRSSGSGAPGSSFRAIATGDLDGDEDVSSFVLEGRVAPSGMLVVSPTVIETDPEE